MVVKHRVADLSYRMYDRFRHSSAFAAAARPGTARDFAGFSDSEYAVLVTFRRDGTPVPTPVWFALVDDRHFVAGTDERTAKVRRIRNDPRVRVFPSDPRGKPLGPAVEGTARVLDGVDDRRLAEDALDRKYGRVRRVYERVMTRPQDMLHIEVVPAAE
jgi:PPOX class probable F420-dependent enzyme